MTSTAHGPKPPGTPRAAPAPRTVRLVLSESAGRWELVVHADPTTAEALRTSGLADGLAVTVSVHPNLVPGQPFDVASVHVETEDAQPVDAGPRPVRASYRSSC